MNGRREIWWYLQKYVWLQKSKCLTYAIRTELTAVMIKYHKFNSSTHWIIHTLNKKPEASLDNALKDNNVTTRAWTINLQGINSSQIRYKFIQFDTSQNFAIVCCQLLAEFNFIVIDRLFFCFYCMIFSIPFIFRYHIRFYQPISNVKKTRKIYLIIRLTYFWKITLSISANVIIQATADASETKVCLLYH